MKAFLKEQKDIILKGMLFIAALMVLTFFVGNLIGVERIHHFVEGLGPWGPIGLVAIKALTVVFAPLSGTAIYIIGGSLYGTAQGFFYVTLGNIIGMSACFYISRIWGQKAIQGIFGVESAKKIVSIVDNLSSTRNHIIARIVLFPLEDFINYAAGLSRLKYWPFIIISVIVTSVRAVAMIYLGDITI